MKKTSALLLMLFLFAFCVFASDSFRVYFPSLSTSSVYPIESSIGQTVPANQSAEHQLLEKALSEPFSFEWCETYLAPAMRKNITTLYSTLLSDLLPSDSVMFSRAYNNSDNSTSISVKFMDSDDVITFVILENYIISLTSSKK